MPWLPVPELYANVAAVGSAAAPELDRLQTRCRKAYEGIYIFHVCPPDCEMSPFREFKFPHNFAEELRSLRTCAPGELEYGKACRQPEHWRCAAS